MHNSTASSLTKRVAHKTANISRKSESANFCALTRQVCFWFPLLAAFWRSFAPLVDHKRIKKSTTRNIEFLFPQRATRCVRACWWHIQCQFSVVFFFRRSGNFCFQFNSRINLFEWKFLTDDAFSLVCHRQSRRKCFIFYDLVLRWSGFVWNVKKCIFLRCEFLKVATLGSQCCSQRPSYYLNQWLLQKIVHPTFQLLVICQTLR